MLLIFDLDGTIIESEEGIINGFLYTLDKMNTQAPSVEQLKKYIGPPLSDTFMNEFKFSKEDAIKAIKYFREYYSQKGKFECRTYDRIEETIKKLSNNYKIAIGTSKAEESAIEILEHFAIAKYFDIICGASKDNKRHEKTDIIEHIIQQTDEEKDKIYMIGDRHYDVVGAKKSNIKSIGVTWGYGTIEELRTAGADYIVEDTEELLTTVTELEQA